MKYIKKFWSRALISVVLASLGSELIFMRTGHPDPKIGSILIWLNAILIFFLFTLIAWFDKYKYYFFPQKDKDDELHEDILGDFEWACDQCIDNDLAEPSNPELQTSIDWRPYLAFFDSERYCEQCNKSYIFSRKEKRFWYEELQFWVQSKPKHCKVCRKEVREKKQINKKLSDLIKRFDELTISELEEIVDCYKKMGKTEKMKYYQSVVNRERKNKK